MATACNPLQGASSRADQRKAADLGVDAPGKVLSLVCRYFLISVGSILLITGAAKIYSALGSARLLDTWDPIFGPSLGLTFRHLLFLVGVLELLLAYACIFQRVTEGVRLYLVVCLAVVCFVYRTGLWLVNWQGACPCLGNLSDALRISPEGVDRMMKGTLAYMFVGGFALSALWVRHRRRTRRAVRTQALSAGSIALFISVGTLLGFSRVASASFGNQDPIQLILRPPRVEKLIAQRTFEDGKKSYILMRYDKGNFVVKMSRTQAALERNSLAVGDDIAGRMDNSVWVFFDGAGENVREADLDKFPSTNQNVLNHQNTTIRLVNGVSRLGRSILSFGIETPFTEQVVGNAGKYEFRDGDFDIQGTVALAESETPGFLTFTAKYKRLKKRGADAGMNEVVEVRGKLTAESKVPSWFELHQLDGTGQRKLLGRVDVLDVKLSDSLLPKYFFLREYNVVGGFTGIKFATNDLVKLATASEALARRPILLWGFSISSAAVRAAVVVLIAAITASAVAILARSLRQNKKHIDTELL